MNVKRGDLVMYYYNDEDKSPELGMYIGKQKGMGKYLRIDWYNRIPNDYSYEVAETVASLRKNFLDYLAKMK